MDEFRVVLNKCIVLSVLTRCSVQWVTWGPAKVHPEGAEGWMCSSDIWRGPHSGPLLGHPTKDKVDWINVLFCFFPLHLLTCFLFLSALPYSFLLPLNSMLLLSLHFAFLWVLGLLGSAIYTFYFFFRFQPDSCSRIVNPYMSGSLT